jgi:uncharacterized protein YejL (UPF0352 family)
MQTSNGASNGIIALQGVLHVEDPGVGLNNLVPGVFIQSRTRSPQVVIQNAKNFNQGVTGNRLTIGINSVAQDIGSVGNVDDVVFDASLAASSAPFIRFGRATYHSGPTVLGPLVSIGATAANAVVGINQDRPKATLHAGCGTSVPITIGTVAFVTNFGDSALAVNDNTNNVEVSLGVGSGVPYLGTATAHDLRIRTNNTNRAILTQTGSLFVGSTSSASYNPEVSVMGLTGFPSAALSIAGNQSADGSVGQLAWYNDSAGAGTRVAFVQVKRSGANNNSTMTLATMNAGTLTPSLFIGATQWVGILNSNPNAALDVTGTIRFSGPLMPGINPGLAGQYLQSAGAGSSPVWTTALGAPGGLNSTLQFNAAGALSGATNFTWTDATSTVGITGTVVINAPGAATLIGSTGIASSTLSLINKIQSNSGTIWLAPYLSRCFFGGGAGNSTGSGDNNTAFGSGTLPIFAAGHDNTAVGTLSLAADNSGSFNVAVGNATLNLVQGGSNNTAVGYYAGGYTVSGSGNTAVGSGAMGLLGSNNTAIGNNALFFNGTTASSSNTAVGATAGQNETGANNTYVGYAAGPVAQIALTNASAIGANAVVGTSNTMVLGGTAANAVSVCIGATNSAATLTVVGNIATNLLTKTASYLIGATDSIVIANAATRGFIVSLPSATNTNGRRYSVKKSDATGNIVMVAPPVGVTIDGATQQTLSSQNQSVDIVNDGQNYWLV